MNDVAQQERNNNKCYASTFGNIQIQINIDNMDNGHCGFQLAQLVKSLMVE